jgi:hypothetical protein
MHLLRRTPLVMTTALAIAVGAAPAATADPVGITHEDGDADCGAILEEGHSIQGLCEAHVVSSEPLVVEVLGTPVSACTGEVELTVDRDGYGYLDDQTLTGGGCTVEACEEEAGETEPWPTQIEEVDTDEYHALVEMCVSNGFTEVECDFEATLGMDGHTVVTVGADDVQCTNAPSMSVTGSWDVEGDSEEYSELALGAPRPLPPIRPIGSTHDFNGAPVNSSRDITFKNYSTTTNYQILAANTDNPERTAPGGGRFSRTDISCTNPTDFKWLNAQAECETRVTKTSVNTPPGPSGVYLWYRDPVTGGGLRSRVFVLYE